MMSRSRLHYCNGGWAGHHVEFIDLVCYADTKLASLLEGTAGKHWVARAAKDKPEEAMPVMTEYWHIME